MKKEIEVEIINDYKMGIGLENISDKYNKDFLEIHSILKNNKVSMSREDWGKVSSIQQRFDIDKDEFYQKFIIENKTRKELADYYQCSEALIKKRCREWGIKKSIKNTLKNTNKTLQTKYGTTQISEINKDKREQTNLKRYGAKTPFESWKIQNKIAKGKPMTINEAVIGRILLDMGLDFENEYVFKPDQSSDRIIFSYDFGVFKDGILWFLIEVDGFYHHAYNAYNKESFLDIIRHKKSDLEKMEFCYRNEIPLLTINEIEKFETESDIIKVVSDFIKKI